MGTPKFIASCWTSGGNVGPGFDSEVSPIDPIDRIEAIAATGWTGFGLPAADLKVVEETIGFKSLYERAQELGLNHIEVEFATDWWLDDSQWRETWELLIRAATTLNAKMIKVGSAFGEPVTDFTPFIAPYRRLAQEAEAIDSKVALEPIPFCLLGTVSQGADLMAAVDHPAAGLVVDYWHIFRGNTSLEELERRVPIEYVFGIELTDARNEIVGTLFEDTRDNRKLLGEGDQDVIGFIKTIQRMGYQGDWGVEILSAEQRSKPILEGLQDAIESARKAFELASN